LEGAVAATAKDLRYPAYWDAIRAKVCSVCLDQADDGSCGLDQRICAVQKYLPAVIDVASRVHSRRMDEYVAAIESEICARCPDQDAKGRCEQREAGTCALYTYLSLILDTVDEVRATDQTEG
jgi:hypothetical protein